MKPENIPKLVFWILALGGTAYVMFYAIGKCKEQISETMEE